MPETGRGGPLPLPEVIWGRDGQGMVRWQQGNFREKSHMGGKEDVANSSQPFRASLFTPLCGHKGELTQVLRPAHLLCTPRLSPPGSLMRSASMVGGEPCLAPACLRLESSS